MWSSCQLGLTDHRKMRDPDPYGIRTRLGARVEFVFVCWRCAEDYVLVGRQVGFWVDRWRLPGKADCWNCGATNTTPDPPWTEAD